MPEGLVDILIIILLAKLAAELSERIGLPAVVGEIVVGVLAGPSMLGWVHDGEIIETLGEIGVILLLFDVGLEMDLDELGAVGRAAISVALIGVALPFIGGAGVGTALGFSTNEAIFVGAALTATSVGITARVFGDLRALATVEARTVLGAAVADDVLGLVILTVVVRLVEVGSISVTETGKVIGIAVAFLVASVVIGIRLAPAVFEWLQRVARSSGTMIGLALAFILALSQLASTAKLAPIIGAFVAGICLSRSPTGHRVGNELRSVGAIFIPVFFFRIGVEADITEFAQPKVLGIAGALLVVAVVGKIVAAVGVGKHPGDKLLIGLGMLPRGEVGLIFATIGLQNDVFGSDVYAALLMVVLLTTLAAPTLLRWRISQLQSTPLGELAAEPEPPGGWLETASGQVELAAVPPSDEAVPIAFDAATRIEAQPPGERLLIWLGTLPNPFEVDGARLRRALSQVFTDGGARSWRFLQITGLLQRTLPELDAALSRRAADPMDPDPLGPHRWSRVGRLHELLAGNGEGDAPRALEGEQLALWLAAVVLDATDGDTSRVAQDLARALAGRLGLGDAAADEVAELVGDAALLRSFTHRLGIRPRDISQLAAHLGDVDRLRSLELLTQAGFELDTIEQQAVDEVVSRTAATLVSGEAGTDDGGYAAHVAAAADLVPPGAVRERLEAAPKSYALRVSVPDLARQTALCEPPPSDRRPRVDVLAGRDLGQWRIVVVARDRIGLLAHEARVLSQAGCDVVDAAIATWEDGVALCSYTVRTWGAPNPDRLRDALSASFGEPLRTEPVELLDLTFDNDASPWHTVCTLEAEDRFGLLGDVAAAFASVGVSVHAAHVATVDGVAVNVFELTTARGEKLGGPEVDGVRRAVSAGVESQRRRLGRRWALVASDPT